MDVLERFVDDSLNTSTLNANEESEVAIRNPNKNRRRVTILDESLIGLNHQNDDEVERIARRRSRLLEPHPEVVNSPAHATARRAAATQFIPQAQVGEHYGNCIRLAAENKITSKNAFDLHLIDIMGDMVKKEDASSFRMASSSLDASAKIYAGRVDAVHQDTYKVLTGLGRSGKKSEKGGADGEGVPGDLDDSGDDASGAGDGDRKRRERRRNHTTKSVICTSLAKVRSKVKALDTDVDPLFQQQAAAYDDGGTVELRLNRLRTHSKYSELLLDSNTPLFRVRADPSSLTCCCGPIELPPFVTLQISEAPMCVAFDNFHFTKDGSLDGADDTLTPMSPVFMEEENALGNTAPVNLVSPAQMEVDNYPDDDDDNAPLPVPDGEEETLVNEGRTGFAIGDQTEAVAIDNQSTSDPKPQQQQQQPTSDGELFVTSLKSMLTTHLENFGQVNDGVLGLWAGPEHWHKKAKRRRLDEFGNVALENEENVTNVGKSHRARSTKKTTKKPSIVYNVTVLDADDCYSNEHMALIRRSDWSKELAVHAEDKGGPNAATAGGGRSAVLREQNLEAAGERFNLLPTSISDARQHLYELCNREVMQNLLNPPAAASGASGNAKSTIQNPLPDVMAEGGVVPPWLDSQAAAAAAEEDERLNGENRLDDDDGMGGGPIDDDDDDYDADDPFGGIFTQGLGTQGTLEEADDGSGVRLIALPRQITRHEIGYARSAKSINVRHLKAVLWSMIESDLGTATAGPNGDKSPPTKKTRMSSDNHMEGGRDLTTNFGDLLASLPEKVSKHTASELSVAIGLNCLLHLANEKDLFLESSKDCTDLSISQGLPASEVELLEHYKRQAAIPRPMKQVSLDRWLDGEED